MKERIALALALAALFAVPALAQRQAAANGDGQVLLQADEVAYDVDKKIVTAHGHVEIDYGGRTLIADSVSYDQNTDKMSADGHVSVMAENGDVAFANHVELHDKMRDGALDGFAALIGKSGRMVASNATREGGNITTAYDAAYTPCKICRERGDRTPLWDVKAYRVVYDQAKHRMKFKNARVEFFGVPVIYTPYYSMPDQTVKHASGILTPEIGHSSFVGYFAKVPIYVALSDSNDLTLTPFVTTEGGEVLETEYRQRRNNGGMWLQASAADNPNGTIAGNVNQVYGHFFGAGDWDVSNIWRTGYDVQLTSNDTYLKRYDISQLDRLVNDIFIEGVKDRSRFALTGYYFEGLRATDNSQLIPFALPDITYTFIPDHKLAAGQLRLDISSVSLFREEQAAGLPTNDQRATAELRYRLPFVTGDGQLITFQADARGDVYHVGQFAPGNPSDSKFITRGLPYIGIDWRWPFVAGGGHGNAFVIQPIAQAIWAPYGGNPAGIPNEDTTSFDLDDNDVFSFDRLPGNDLVETGPRANVGMQADAYFTGGSVEAVLGEVLRLKPDPVFAADTGLAGTTSDIVGRLSIKFPPYIDLTHRIDIDKDTGSVRRNEVYLTGIFGRSSLQVSYLRLAPEPSQGLTAREEVNAQATLGLFDHWEAFAAGRRDLLASQMLDSEFGFGYEDECLGIALAYRRRYTTDRDLPPSTAILLRFQLKTGDQPYEPFSLFPKDVFSRP